VTQLLLTDLEALLHQPGPLLASLRYNYLYGALFANCYGQPYESGVRYAQPGGSPASSPRPTCGWPSV
jgi:hypothetical protein